MSKKNQSEVKYPNPNNPNINRQMVNLPSEMNSYGRSKLDIGLITPSYKLSNNPNKKDFLSRDHMLTLLGSFQREIGRKLSDDEANEFFNTLKKVDKNKSFLNTNVNTYRALTGDTKTDFLDETGELSINKLAELGLDKTNNYYDDVNNKVYSHAGLHSIYSRARDMFLNSRGRDVSKIGTELKRFVYTPSKPVEVEGKPIELMIESGDSYTPIDEALKLRTHNILERHALNKQIEALGVRQNKTRLAQLKKKGGKINNFGGFDAYLNILKNFNT